MFHVLLCVLLVSRVLAGDRREISVWLDGSEWKYKSGIDTSTIAYGWVQDELFTQGWDTVEISSNGDRPNSQQAFAVGYAEGLLTVDRIQQRFRNRNSTHHRHHHPHERKGVCRGAEKEVSQNMAFIQREIQHPKNSYWQQVKLSWTQVEGLLEGYNRLAEDKVTMMDMYCMQAGPELYDFLRSRPTFQWPNFGAFSPNDWSHYFEEAMHCSSLIKVSDDLSELYFGHSTWSGYHSMMRQMKTYNLRYKDVDNSAETVIFSGYPGVTVSIDDFYVLSSGLSVIETTIDVFNQSLYTNYIRPSEQVPYWLRVLNANRMAKDAAEWGPIFGEYNSGTYNNQWIVVDIKKFTPKEPVKPGTLYILEQIPGFIRNGDQSDILQFGYWPSYNVPFYPFIYSITNYTKTAPMQPHTLSYQQCSRSEIFRRSQTTAGPSLDAYKALMRYNDYKHDPLSMGNPGYAIASRFDLAKETPGCWGATDTKVSSASLFHKGMVVHAISGPTRSHGLPPFAWNTTRAQCGPDMGPKKGLPEVYDFEFEVFQPEKM
eukprot:TRINITY_DN66617_c2_g1_i1.p1 TRINITY_DN66617_c2_g1~~TRINITY_DN66617_c2_g1_i1.p1  ORF type:complete len:542 (+),score=59.37 TRINITY_DN66617_c2_g1_i1:22-1647(+)